MASEGTNRSRRTHGRWIRSAGVRLLLVAPAVVMPTMGAIDLRLTSAAVERAIKIGMGTDAERARFHAGYIFPIDVMAEPATIERVEVLTAVRRVVLAAEEHLRMGDHMFSVRPATEAVLPWRDKVTLALHVRFHPQNTLVSVPPYDISLGERGPAPIAVRRTPRYPLPSGGQGRGTAMPIYGAIIEVDFDAAGVDQASRAVTVMLDGRHLARTTVNFARLD